MNTWDVPVNADWTQIDKAFGNSASKNSTGLSGNQTLAVADYVPLTLIITGLPTAAITYVVPSGVGGQWVFANATTGGFAVGIKSNAGGTTILCPAGQNTLVSCDGTATGMRLSITTNPVAAGSNTQVQFNSSGITAGSSGFTFDGLTVAMTGLNVFGDAQLGSGPGSLITINGLAVAIPHNLSFDSNTLFLDAVNHRVGIGTNTPANLLSVAGNIQSTAGGFIFPDNSVQTTSAAVTTGFMQDYIGTTAPVGWVFANGQTIGNAVSGAIGRANADTAPLFTLLWNSWADAQAPVSGGRGANPAADFAANKTIQLPDLRGRTAVAPDAFGGSVNAGRIGSTTPGLGFGSNVSATGGFAMTGTNNINFGAVAVTGSGDGTIVGAGGAYYLNGTASAVVNGSFGIIVSGASGAFSIVQPGILINKLIKL